MKISIREYKESDLDSMVRFIEKLQDFLVSIDPLKRYRRLPEYGVHSTNEVLDLVKNNQGKIFFAVHNDIPIGMIAAYVDRRNYDDNLEMKENKIGHIVCFYVEEKYRHGGIGKLLMSKIKKYLISIKCDYSLIKVEPFNANALNFYHKIGFQDRFLELMTKLK